MNAKFTWGDSVKVINTAPIRFLPNKVGEICGVFNIETAQEANRWEYPIGTVIYTVEFSDGNSEEIPEPFLENLT